jgi:iron complex outermembrane receptor protein
MKYRKSTTIAAAVAAVLLSASAVSAQASAQADAQPGIETHDKTLAAASGQPIASQSLAQALDEFAARTGLQVVYRSDIAARVRTRGAAGNLSPQQTLEQLLEGTGLRYEFINERTVAIRPMTDAAAFTPQPTSDRGAAMDGARLRLARLTLDQIGSESLQQTTAAALDTSRSAQLIELEEVLVTGSHIRGPKEPAAPTQVITRDDIQKTGYTKLEAVLEDLPQNFGSVGTDTSLSRQGGRLTTGNVAARGASVDLRGLGAESTLTLLNGRRVAAGSGSGRVVDISVIPLSLIERVEVVSGGQSAIYGADAVAGVVNFITRRDFDGFETQVTRGFATEHGGGEQWQVSQLAGYSGERLGLVAAYDYSHTEPLNLKNLGLLSERDDYGRPVIRESIPDQSTHSVFLSGRYTLTDAVKIVADAFYSKKDSLATDAIWYDDAPRVSYDRTDFVNDQYGAALGLEWALGRDWLLNVSGNVGQAGTGYVLSYNDSFPDFEYIGSIGVEQDVGTRSFAAIADGGLPEILGMQPRLALGVEYRSDDIRTVSGTRATRLERDVKAAFSELLLPIVTNGAAGLRSLELSIAARYDDYDDLGSTFNPQGGIVWRVTDSFKVLASFTEAFRAPALLDTSSSGYHDVDWRWDPQVGGRSPVLLLSGTSPNLKPETARSWSVGFELEPQFARRTRLSASYFAIDYRDRLERPITALVDSERMLINAAFYPGQIVRNPTPEQLAAIIATDSDGRIDNATGVAFNPDGSDLLSVFPDLVVFDNRIANIAVEKFSGVDVGANVEWGTRSSWNAGLNATYTLRHDRYITETSPAITAIDGVGKPVRLRMRANLGWNRGPWGAYLYANYSDGYENAMPFATSDVSSWLTLNASLRFDGSSFGAGSLWNGLSATLSVDNLLDEDPPFVSGESGDALLYDPLNASAMGRFVSLRLTKRW